MKKVLSFTAIAALAASIVACGPGKEEMEAKEKAKRDSIMADSTKRADEARMQWVTDSTNKAMMEMEANKKMADSLHADSVAKKLIKEPKKK
jgi:hypothetical protein